MPRRSPGADDQLPNVAALERSDNVADSDHAFALLKRGYSRSASHKDHREELRG